MSQLRLILAGGGIRELRLAAGLAQEAGAQVRLADDGAEALSFARLHGADLILAEVGCDVPALIAALRRERIMTPLLACGVDAPATIAVAAVRAGAVDYLPLPPSRELIAAALLIIGHRSADLVGEAPEWRRLVALAERVAPARTPVLVTGPPGSGKQALARHLHNCSGRSGPLVALDGLSGAAPEDLASELFGHRAEAFAGAIADRPGKLREASGGTLLLRRAEALPASLQDALVPVLRATDARLVVTTASRAELRPALAAALSLIELSVPPLTARRGDIPALARHIASQFCVAEGLAPVRFEAGALDALAACALPGNVAELEQRVQRAVLLAGGGTVTAADLVPAREGQPGSARPEVDDLVGRSMEEVERALILGTLDRCRGNRTSASAILGISVRTMRNKLRAFQDEGYRIAPAA